MNWVINHLVSLFAMEYFTLPPCNAFIVNLQWDFFFFFVNPSLQFRINNSKESTFKTVWNLGWMEMRQKEGKNGSACCLWWFSALSQNTALSFDTMTYLWLLCYFLLVHKETNRNPIVSPCRQTVLLAFCRISMDNFWLILLTVTSWTDWKQKFKLRKWKDGVLSFGPIKILSAVLMSVDIHQLKSFSAFWKTSSCGCFFPEHWGLVKLHDHTVLTVYQPQDQKSNRPCCSQEKRDG